MFSQLNFNEQLNIIQKENKQSTSLFNKKKSSILSTPVVQNCSTKTSEKRLNESDKDSNNSKSMMIIKEEDCKEEDESIPCTSMVHRVQALPRRIKDDT